MGKETHWTCDRCDERETGSNPPNGWTRLQMKSLWLEEDTYRTPGGPTFSPVTATLCNDCANHIKAEALEASIGAAK